MPFAGRSAPVPVVLTLTATVAVAGCREAPGGDETAGATTDGALAGPAMPAVDFEVRASEYTFDVPSEAPSGWVTYRVNNESANEIHEVSLGRLPEGRTHEDYVNDVVRVWTDVAERIDTGELEGADPYAVAGESLPAWAGDIHYVRARGLVSPGRSTLNTQHLEPGLYTIDCWVRSPSGQLHLAAGMSRPLIVTQATSTVPPPAHDITIRVSAGDVLADGDPGTGNRTIGLAADTDADNVHLVRLADGTDPDSVIRWMNWGASAGLQAPAPAEFLGGINRYGNPDPEGHASFTALDIRPGRYAWIVETPGGERPGLWSEFVVE
jgi:hypothetical protein